jgi:WD40 repeat protein
VAEVASSPLGKLSGEFGVRAFFVALEERSSPYVWVCVAFTPDGRMLAADGQGSDISLWDPSIVSVRVRLSPDEPPSAIAFSPSGHTLASTYTSGAIRIWDRSAVPPP